VDLLDRTELSSRERELLRVLRSSSSGLVGLIADLLDYSRIEAGAMALVPAPFSLRRCIDAALDTVSEAAARKGLRLVSSIDGDVPDELISDERRVRQILLNLLSNGVKFTASGEVRVHASARRRSDARWDVCIAVHDTGRGIPAHLLPRLFQRFSQLDATLSREQGGVGLGLAISDRLARLLGGSLAVESTPGQGSVFTFAFPAPSAGDSQAARPEEHHHPGALAAAKAAAGPSILLVEDDDANRRIAYLMLTELGYQADVAATGAEALERARARPYDVVLMDLHMPGLDGLETARRLRAEFPGRRPSIIALTASALPQDEAWCRDAGMDGYVSKPLRLDALAQALKQTPHVGTESGETRA
jgi:CheY-like chemotaxis protein